MTNSGRPVTIPLNLSQPSPWRLAHGTPGGPPSSPVRKRPIFAEKEIKASGLSNSLKTTELPNGKRRPVWRQSPFPSTMHALSARFPLPPSSRVLALPLTTLCLQGASRADFSHSQTPKSAHVNSSPGGSSRGPPSLTVGQLAHCLGVPTK